MKTSNNSWQARLSLWAQSRNKRLALVGVGNEQRRDDAAGVIIARRLASLACNNLLIVDAGHAPENAAGLLRRFVPDSVLLVDAAEMGEEEGAVRWVETADIAGMSASTHSLPLSMLAEYLRMELGCEVLLLGIQPASTEYGEGLSAEVERAVEEAVDVIANGRARGGS